MKTKLIIFVFLLITFFIASSKAHADEKASGSSATFAGVLAQQSQDTRAKTLKTYLDNHDSPLAQYAELFVRQADINHIPWDLLVAISGTESTFGHAVPSPTCNNAWGYGIYGDQTRCFDTYQDAIITISKDLREKYIDKWGARDVYDIGRIYAASPTWADHTTYFMHQIENLQLELTMQSLPISL